MSQFFPLLHTFICRIISKKIPHRTVPKSNIKTVEKDAKSIPKNKLKWRNDRVYVKIVLYSSVTPLSEGKMVMNE